MIVFVGHKLTEKDEQKHGAQYHTTMGKKNSWHSYSITNVAICNKRVKMDHPPKKNSMPLPITSDDVVQRLNDALNNAHMYVIKCNLCCLQQGSSTSQTVLCDSPSQTLQPKQKMVRMQLMKQQHSKKRLESNPCNLRVKKAKTKLITTTFSETSDTDCDSRSC